MPKIDIDGEIRDMTAEEIAEMQRREMEMSGREQTEDEWRINIEAALIELAAMIAGGGN